MLNHLFENNELVLRDKDIVMIAWEAVERRRLAGSVRGKQRLMDGTIVEYGYVTYKDYDDYVERIKQQEHLNLQWDMRRLRDRIKNTLLSEVWRYSPHHPETRFYPPRLG